MNKRCRLKSVGKPWVNEISNDDFSDCAFAWSEDIRNSYGMITDDELKFNVERDISGVLIISKIKEEEMNIQEQYNKVEKELERLGKMLEDSKDTGWAKECDEYINSIDRLGHISFGGNYRIQQEIANAFSHTMKGDNLTKYWALKQSVMRRIARWQAENDDVVDWSDGGFNKFQMFYAHDDDTIGIEYFDVAQDFNTSFTSSAKIEQMLKEEPQIKADYIKVATWEL